MMLAEANETFACHLGSQYVILVLRFPGLYFFSVVECSQKSKQREQNIKFTGMGLPPPPCLRLWFKDTFKVLFNKEFLSI